jgi:hypothetical protein
MSLGGVTRELSGVGYHDHNWGNIALRKLVDHWYWGRAHIGDYTAVTLMAYANETYGKVASPAFMLAKGNEIVVSNAEHVRFSEAEPGVVAHTGVPMANRLCYEYEHGSDHYKLTYVRRADNYTLDFGPVGAYQRFVGDVVLDRRVDGRALPTLHADALWELLYFGPR